MRKSVTILVAIVLSYTMLLNSSAEGLLPELAELYGVAMPSLFDTLNRAPDEQKAMDDESVQEVWFDVTDDEYSQFGQFLSNSGCEMLSYVVEGSIFKAEVGKKGKSFFFAYDADKKTAELLYPKGTFDGKLDDTERMYQQALEFCEKRDIIKARYSLWKVRGYKDSNIYLNDITESVDHKLSLNGYWSTLLGIKTDGSVLVSVGRDEYGFSKAQKWNNILSISQSRDHIVGLKKDGTVVAVGSNRAGACNVDNWKDIIEVHADGYAVDNELDKTFTVGLKADGTVVAVGNNEYGQCYTTDWSNIVSIQTCTSKIGSGGVHEVTVGLRADGTVITTDEELNQIVSDWSDVKSVYTGKYGFGTIMIVGLKNNGTVYSTKSGFEDWTDIQRIAVGGFHMIGIKADGTVVSSVKGTNHPEGDVSRWKEIIAVAASDDNTIGLKADGTVLATGDNTFGECDIQSWNGIVAVYTTFSETYGIKADGSVVSTSQDHNVDDWELLDEWNLSNHAVNTEDKTENQDIQYPTLKKGSTGEAVTLLQNALIRVGVLNGKADGNFGRMTEDAVKQMQTEYGMEATGIADEGFQKKLYGE